MQGRNDANDLNSFKNVPQKQSFQSDLSTTPTNYDSTPMSPQKKRICLEDLSEKLSQNHYKLKHEELMTVSLLFRDPKLLGTCYNDPIKIKEEHLQKGEKVPAQNNPQLPFQCDTRLQIDKIGQSLLSQAKYLINSTSVPGMQMGSIQNIKSENGENLDVKLNSNKAKSSNKHKSVNQNTSQSNFIDSLQMQNNLKSSNKQSNQQSTQEKYPRNVQENRSSPAFGSSMQQQEIENNQLRNQKSQQASRKTTNGSFPNYGSPPPNQTDVIKVQGSYNGSNYNIKNRSKPSQEFFNSLVFDNNLIKEQNSQNFKFHAHLKDKVGPLDTAKVNQNSSNNLIDQITPTSQLNRNMDMTASSANEYQSPTNCKMNYQQQSIHEVNEDEVGTPGFTNDVSRNQPSPISDLKLGQISKKITSSSGSQGSSFYVQYQSPTLGQGINKTNENSLTLKSLNEFQCHSGSNNYPQEQQYQSNQANSSKQLFQQQVSVQNNFTAYSSQVQQAIVNAMSPTSLQHQDYFNQMSLSPATYRNKNQSPKLGFFNQNSSSNKHQTAHCMEIDESPVSQFKCENPDMQTSNNFESNNNPCTLVGQKRKVPESRQNNIRNRVINEVSSQEYSDLSSKQNIQKRESKYNQKSQQLNQIAQIKQQQIKTTDSPDYVEVPEVQHIQRGRETEQNMEKTQRRLREIKQQRMLQKKMKNEQQLKVKDETSQVIQYKNEQEVALKHCKDETMEEQKEDQVQINTTTSLATQDKNKIQAVKQEKKSNSEKQKLAKNMYKSSLDNYNEIFKIVKDDKDLKFMFEKILNLQQRATNIKNFRLHTFLNLCLSTLQVFDQIDEQVLQRPDQIRLDLGKQVSQHRCKHIKVLLKLSKKLDKKFIQLSDIKSDPDIVPSKDSGKTRGQQQNSSKSKQSSQPDDQQKQLVREKSHFNMMCAILNYLLSAYCKDFIQSCAVAKLQDKNKKAAEFSLAIGSSAYKTAKELQKLFNQANTDIQQNDSLIVQQRKEAFNDDVKVFINQENYHQYLNECERRLINVDQRFVTSESVKQLLAQMEKDVRCQRLALPRKPILPSIYNQAPLIKQETTVNTNPSTQKRAAKTMTLRSSSSNDQNSQLQQRNEGKVMESGEFSLSSIAGLLQLEFRNIIGALKHSQSQ
eukprot:403353124